MSDGLTTEPAPIRQVEAAAYAAMHAGVALRMAEECARQYRECHHITGPSGRTAGSGAQMPPPSNAVSTPFHASGDTA